MRARRCALSVTFMSSSDLSTPTRRKFLSRAAIAATAGTAAGCGAALSPWRFFTAAEARALEAICECIIPDDDQPGARGAGVIGYIDRQLSGKFRESRGVYREGIATANRLAGGVFAEAPAARQLDVMRQLELDPASKPFFDLAVAHSMQGFYGSPRHGGNRDFASWRMLGLPLSPSRGRNLYEFGKGDSREKS
jgi:gluconate 2-dehydrogenase gamma chain